MACKKTDLPHIVTSGGTTNLSFLIDTGVTHNVIFGYVYEHFKEKLKRVDGNQSIGIEENYQKIPIIEATFNFEGIDNTSSFSVLDDSSAMKQVK